MRNKPVRANKQTEIFKEDNIMKNQNLYNVTVYATLSKDVLVYAENEDAALNYVQDVCDNTDLISFDGREILDVTAEEVEEIEPADKGAPAEECYEKRRGNRACCISCGGFSCGRLADDEGDDKEDEGDEEDDEDDPCLRSLLSAGEEIYMLRQIARALLLDNLMGRLRK